MVFLTCRRELSTAADWADQRSPASKNSFRRHCDPCGRAEPPTVAARALVPHTLQYPGSAPGSAHATLRRAAVPPAVAGAAYRQLPMLVGKSRHRPREAFVPLRPILFLQKYVSGSQVRDLGQTQLFDQPILGR